MPKITKLELDKKLKEWITESETKKTKPFRKE